MNLPNALTLARILLVPVFGWLWLTGRHGPALWAFVIGGLTDVLDGLLARALDQRTRLGALLDPAADKLTLLVAFLVAVSVGSVPWWLAALVIGRDIVLSSAAAVYTLVRHRRWDPSEWHPTRIGKYATFFQLATIALALVARAADSDLLRPWVGGLVLVTTAITTVALLQYLAAGVRLFRRTDGAERASPQPA